MQNICVSKIKPVHYWLLKVKKIFLLITFLDSQQKVPSSSKEQTFPLFFLRTTGKEEEGIYCNKIMELILRGKINYDGKIINWYEISNEVFCRTNGNCLTYW